METEEKSKPKKVEFVEKVKKVPYICVVPAGGLRAIKCYPDARTFFARGQRVGYSLRGQRVGYSLRERTLLVPYSSDTKKAIEGLVASGWFEFSQEILERYGITESPKNDKSITEN